MTTCASELAKKCAYQPALRFIDACEKAIGPDCRIPELMFERAKILKANKDLPMATYLFKKLLEGKGRGGRMEDVKFRIEAHSELAEIEQNNDQAYGHLKEAARLSTEITQEHEGVCARNFIKLAIFAEKRYLEFVSYIDGPAYRLKRNAIRQWQTECSMSYGIDQRDSERKKRELLCETNDIRRVESNRIHYLTESVKNYLLALQMGNADKTVPHRVASLLMKNKAERFLEDIISLINGIPPCTWLPVINVLSSYLFDRQLAIYRVVERIILMALVAHPYHVANSLLFYFRTSSNDAQVSEVKLQKTSEAEKTCRQAGSNLRPLELD